MKKLILISLLSLVFAVAAQATEEKTTLVFQKQQKIVTYQEIMQANAGSFGYLQSLVDENICYTGKDFEIIDMLNHGLNHFGDEVCDKYIIVTGTTIIAGPCFMKEGDGSIYQLPIPTCNK